ncbi:MAG: hypothetical protein JWM12_2324, partial [Ilumatobacteraceae bacterium]|nr:hypothetical protein [Ilumatobacteraceae bacterium]
MEPIDDELPTLSIGLFRATPDGQVRAANTAFTALVAPGAGDITGHAPWANAEPADRAVAEAVWQEAAAAGRTVHVEFPLWQPHGQTSWVR